MQNYCIKHGAFVPGHGYCVTCITEMNLYKSRPDKPENNCKPAVPLTEADVRRIVNEELDKRGVK